jgi:hypothetical protein
MPSYLVLRTHVVQVQSYVNMTCTSDLPWPVAWEPSSKVLETNPVSALVVWARLTLQLFCRP